MLKWNIFSKKEDLALETMNLKLFNFLSKTATACKIKSQKFQPDHENNFI